LTSSASRAEDPADDADARLTAQVLDEQRRVAVGRRNAERLLFAIEHRDRRLARDDRLRARVHDQLTEASRVGRARQTARKRVGRDDAPDRCLRRRAIEERGEALHVLEDQQLRQRPVAAEEQHDGGGAGRVQRHARPRAAIDRHRDRHLVLRVNGEIGDVERLKNQRRGGYVARLGDHAPRVVTHAEEAGRTVENRRQSRDDESAGRLEVERRVDGRLERPEVGDLVGEQEFESRHDVNPRVFATTIPHSWRAPGLIEVK
jgi:hypothetical protein